MSASRPCPSSASHPVKTVIANWKLHGSIAQVEGWIDALQSLEVIRSGRIQLILCPPAIWLDRACKETRGRPIVLGAQNVAAHDRGPYTGEISAAMAFEAGARYTLVGHSERRRLFGETEQMVREKIGQAVRAGLVPVVCIGETAEERRAGETETVLTRQLEAIRALCEESGPDPWVAYEPVWSIGTGIPAAPEELVEIVTFIRAQMASANATMRNRLRLLYGGSVSAGNAALLGCLQGIDGLLVGGASVEADSMAALCRAVGGEESPDGYEVGADAGSSLRG